MAGEDPSSRKAMKGETGCSIPVVHLLWEQADRVRFSAPRQNKRPINCNSARLMLKFPHEAGVQHSIFAGHIG